ncbi:hypothetical protein [Spiroplasma endosymbiont of Dactylopius coccus]
MPNELEQTSNYTLTKILRTGLSPLSAMVGVICITFIRYAKLYI